MPIKESARKYMRVAKSKTIQNIAKKKTFRKAVKTTLEAVKANSLKEATELFKTAQKALDKATKTGILKKNTAARKKSRLVKKIKALVK